MTPAPGFWARRRAAVQAEELAERKEFERQQDMRTTDSEAADERTDEEILADLGLPDPDTMKPGDDFGAFLAQAVPRHLQRRAMRRLWRSNPVLACVDGLNDYDQDYLAASRDQGPIRTSYQVGRGMLSYLEDAGRKAPAAAEDDAVAEEVVAEEVHAPAEDDSESAASVPVAEAEPAEPEPEHETPAPRRMRVRFGEDTA